MLYVAEYMPKGNLEMEILRDQERRLGSSKPRLLGWHSYGRSVALDIAHGLAFLHALKARLSCCLQYQAVQRVPAGGDRSEPRQLIHPAHALSCMVSVSKWRLTPQ